MDTATRQKYLGAIERYIFEINLHDEIVPRRGKVNEMVLSVLGYCWKLVHHWTPYKDQFYIEVIDILQKNATYMEAIETVCEHKKGSRNLDKKIDFLYDQIARAILRKMVQEQEDTMNVTKTTRE